MKMSVKVIAVNAILAAVYAARTVAVAPLSYGNLQFRFSEILLFLAFYDIRFFPGLILGCLIANLFSPMVAFDVPFGTLATVIACFGCLLARKLILKENAGLFAVPFVGAAANGLLVGLALYLAYELPYWITVLEVAGGEFAVLLVGAFVFLGISKIKAIQKILSWQI